MTITGIPNEGTTEMLNLRYNGQTVTMHLTNGLSYSATTTAANVTAASVASDSAVAPAATINGTTGDAEINMSFTIAGGVSGINFDGRAFVVNGKIAAYVDFESVPQSIGIGEDRIFYFRPTEGGTVIYGG